MNCNCEDILDNIEFPLSTGLPGATGATGPAGTSTLYNNFGDVGTDAGILLKVLDTYTLPANTLDSNGDCIKITALFQLAADDPLLNNDRKISIYFGGNLLMVKTIDYIISSSNRYAKFECYVNMKNAALAVTQTEYTQFGFPSGVSTGPYLNVALATDFTANQVINVTGQNVVDAIVDSIICRELKVELYKIA